jgi:hypothetical protein
LVVEHDHAVARFQLSQGVQVDPGLEGRRGLKACVKLCHRGEEDIQTTARARTSTSPKNDSRQNEKAFTRMRSHSSAQEARHDASNARVADRVQQIASGVIGMRHRSEPIFSRRACAACGG